MPAPSDQSTSGPDAPPNRAQSTRGLSTAIEIDVVKNASEELVRALARLLPQLSDAPAPTVRQLDEIISNPGTYLFLARDAKEVAGTLTLVVLDLLTGTKALIEDVVVDASYRGQGIGASLVERALELATNLGASTVELTSRPSREAANRLYERIGFARRETNVWRWSASAP